jgi:hypothetical protein
VTLRTILSHDLGLCPVNPAGRTNHANPAARPIVHFIYVGLAIYVALSASQLIRVTQKKRETVKFLFP